MQNKSERYRAAIYDSAVVRSTISGVITTADGSQYTLTDSDIIPGSLKINNKSVNGSSFELGAVYQGQLTVTLKKGIDRYKVMGAKIEFTEHRYISETETEPVYLGAYYISEPSRSKLLLDIKALDRMDNFDIEIRDDIVGTPYQLLSVAAEMCGVELEQGEAYFNSLPNGKQMVSVYADLVETYRDMIAYIGMLTCTFGTIANDKLRMAKYPTGPNLSITAGKRDKTVIEDYETYYYGVKARFVADSNYAPYSYIDDTITGGLMMDLGDIPLVRGMPETKNQILQTIFETLKQIRYTPASFSLLTSDGALELGDRIKLDPATETYITSYTYVYHGSESIKGSGDNPRIKGKDKASKHLADLEESINAKNVIVHSYTNAQNITIKEQEKEIISINYAAVVDTKPLFIATVPISMNLDGELILNYYIDGVLIPEDTVIEYLSRGNHFVTVSNNFAAEKDSRATVSVKAYMTYAESDIRQQAAKIASFEQYISTGSYTVRAVDTTIPTATIKKGTIKAVLYAQGLVGTEAWDGTINASEEMGEIAIMPILVEDMVDNVNTGCVVPIFNEQITMEYMGEIKHGAIKVED